MGTVQGFQRRWRGRRLGKRGRGDIISDEGAEGWRGLEGRCSCWWAEQSALIRRHRMRKQAQQRREVTPRG